jgi:hypothetical protein
VRYLYGAAECINERACSHDGLHRQQSAGHKEPARLQGREDATRASDMLLYAVSLQSGIPYET